MPGKSAKEAVSEFASTLNESLSCVSDEPLSAYQESAKLFKVLHPAPVRVHSRTGERFYLSITLTCAAHQSISGAFQVRTRQYSYVFSDSKAFTHHGVVSYHWHPDDFAVRDPHLHLKITPNLGYPEIERKIARAHYPTAHICLEDFIRLLIDYYDLQPLIHHSSWKRILRKNKAAFNKEAIEPPASS